MKGKTRAKRKQKDLGLDEAGGSVLYEGPSLIDGEPIVVIMTYGSNNEKTGDIHQTWILLQDVSPVDGVKTGQDESICGDCVHRPTLAEDEGEARCYVNVGQAPQAVWKKYKRGGYPTISLDEACAIVDGDMVRFGAYGDPGAVESTLWERLADACADHTGYTHRWRDTGKGLAGIAMASVDSSDEMIEAWGKGFATFRVEKSSDAMRDPVKGEAICPSPKVSCLTCPLKCNGSTGKVNGRRILDHGPGGEGRKAA